ncbi:MAG: SBBP repeat-containing protein [Bryobacteraceae bacterium]
MRIFTLFIIGFGFFGLTFSQAAAVPNFGKLPLGFEPNRGQADSAVLYQARGTGYLLSLEASGPRILLRHGDQAAEITMRLTGGAKTPHLDTSGKLPGHSSYFRGMDSSKWVTGVPNFAQVRAAGVYPGIDLLYHGNQSRLEYDFVVSPGADPRAIRMRFGGVRSLRTDAGGNLAIATAAGEIVERKPAIYQTAGDSRRVIDGHFVVHAGRTVSFEVGSYDRTKTLVIDPVLYYSSFLGGSGTDEGHAVAADGNGNLYLTGVTYSTPNGDADVLIRKISQDGSGFVYSADIGGSGNDIGDGIAVDISGSAYVGGRTRSLDFPVAYAYQRHNFGLDNAFILRLDATGSTLIFSTYLGGSGDDRGFAVALDAQGSVYLAGTESSVDFPVSQGVFQAQNYGGLDCFVTKFDYLGNPIFSTLVGGGADDQAFGIAVDQYGDSFITGQTGSDDFPQVSPSFQTGRQGGLDAFVTEITPDGTGLVYSTFAGGSNDDIGNAIAVDPNGNAYVTGTTFSGDFPTTNNSFQPQYAGGKTDAFVLAYSVNGQGLMFATYIGSHGTDDGESIALDGYDNVYITGDSNSDQYPVTQDAVQFNRTAGFDAMVSVLDPTGTNLLYSTFLGGSGDDTGLGIALDPNADVYVTGVTSSGDFPVTQGAAQTQAGGGNTDAFFALIAFSNSGSQAFSAGSKSARSVFGRGMAGPPAPGKFIAPSADAQGKSRQNRPDEARFRRSRGGMTVAR